MIIDTALPQERKRKNILYICVGEKDDGQRRICERLVDLRAISHFALAILINGTKVKNILKKDVINNTIYSK